MKKVSIYTDGACSGNPGLGGFCALLMYNGNEKVVSGSEKDTTNNRMELKAVIEGLKALKVKCDVDLYSDSQYVTDAFNQHWIDGWLKNNWKNSTKKPVKNKSLWLRLLKAMEPHDVKFQWIKGHAGHPENERCDKKAVEEYQKYL